MPLVEIHSTPPPYQARSFFTFFLFNLSILLYTPIHRKAPSAPYPGELLALFSFSLSQDHTSSIFKKHRADIAFANTFTQKICCLNRNSGIVAPHCCHLHSDKHPLLRFTTGTQPRCTSCLLSKRRLNRHNTILHNNKLTELPPQDIAYKFLRNCWLYIEHIASHLLLICSSHLILSLWSLLRIVFVSSTHIYSTEKEDQGQG